MPVFIKEGDWEEFLFGVEKPDDNGGLEFSERVKESSFFVFAKRRSKAMLAHFKTFRENSLFNQLSSAGFHCRALS